MKKQISYIMILLIVNVVLRCLWLTFVHPSQAADFEWYFVHASNMASGHGYWWEGHYTAYWPIGWPFILSILFKITGPSVWAGITLNVMFSLGIVFLVFALTKRLTHSLNIAFIGALAYTFLPSQIQWNSVLGSEESFTFVILLSLFIYLFTNSKKWLMIVALSGLIAGFACDIRPIPVLFPIFILLYEWWINRKGFPKALSHSVAYTISMFIGILPVTIRNRIVMHHWILISTNGGVNLWQGLHTNSGYYWAWHNNPLLKYGSTNEIMEDKIGKQLFLHHFISDPLNVFHMGIFKIISLYKEDTNALWYTIHGVNEYSAYTQTWSHIDTIAYAIFMLIALVGLIRVFYHRIIEWKKIGLILTFILYYTSVFTVFPAWDRFRYPLMPLFAILIGIAFIHKNESKNEDVI